MCKVSFIAKVTDTNREMAWAFMELLGEVMSRSNNDGLGYAAFDKSGNLFGERWLRNDYAFTDFSKQKHLNPRKIEQLYNFFGDKVLKQEAQAIILHTRMATCAKNIENTHPFIDNMDSPRTAIIHNGVIANDHELEKKFSSCDSEVLVHLYEKHNVREKLESVKNVTAELLGWYTVINLTKDNDNRMIIDVYSDAPRLNSYFVEELGTRVYCTAAIDIEEVADHFDFTIRDREQIRANTAMRIDVLTGEVIASTRSISKFDFGILDKPRTSEPGIIRVEGNFDDEKFRQNFLRLRGRTDV